MARYIDEELLIEKMLRLRGCSCSYSDGIIDEVEDIMSDLPTADVIPIPDGATNGDMIKAMFKDFESALLLQVISKEWWNAPYKKEVEE